MKVKELMDRLKELDPEKEVTYECMYVDYVSDQPTGNVDLGGYHIELFKDNPVHLLINKGNPRIQILAPEIVKERNPIGHEFYEIPGIVGTWVTKPHFYALDWTFVD